MKDRIEIAGYHYFTLKPILHNLLDSQDNTIRLDNCKDVIDRLKKEISNIELAINAIEASEHETRLYNKKKMLEIISYEAQDININMENK